MSANAPLLQVRGLRKHFGGLRAVHDVGFELARGEVLALIGPNGAGKSTCFNLLHGQLRADAGSARLNGVELLSQSPRAVWGMGVGRTFQITETFTSMSVLQNVQLALMAPTRRLWGLWHSAAPQNRDGAMLLLAQVGMQDQAERAVSVLAYGDVKRVELAMALANKPQLLLMDEPTAGMASAERHALMALVARLAAERKMGVLFTEHSMDVVFAHAHRLLVMARGELIANGAPAEVRQDPRVREAYFGHGLALPQEPAHG